MVDSSLLTTSTVQSLILVSVCSCAYGPYLKGDFVFDDSVAIVRNKDVTSTGSVWSHDFWGARLMDTTSHKSYRPLTTLMFRLENRIFGLNPTQMKTVNFGLHLAISLLLPPLQAALRFEDKRVRFYTALLFAVHPVHVEAVSGIVSRAELMVGLLFVVSLMIYISNCRSIVTLPLVALIQSVAILFKETGIVILPTCILIDLCQNNEFTISRRKLKISKQTVIKNSISLVITLLHVYVRLKIIDFTSPTFKLQDNPGAMHASFVVRALTQQYLYALNFWICLCPQWLSFDWAIGSIPLVMGFSDYRIVFVMAFHLLLILIVWTWKRNLLMALGCLVIPFLPASGLIKLGFVVAERVLYIPSFGFCMLISIGFDNLTKNYKKFRKILEGALGILVLVFILRTQQRASDWQTEEKLFKSALKIVPNNAKVYYNIARLSTDMNDKPLAFAYYKKAIDLYPEYEAALMNLGNLYREIQEYELAEQHLRRALSIVEDFPAAWMNLGIVQAGMGNYNDALISYRRALGLRKNYPNCLYNIGNLYLELKNTSLAMKFWHDAIALNPKHQLAWANILALLDNQGKAEAVVETSEAALQHLPDEPSILFTRANALGKLNRFDESERIFRRIIDKRPDYPLYHANLGVLYHRWRKPEMAMQFYASALRLDPNLASARENLNKLSAKVLGAG